MWEKKDLTGDMNDLHDRDNSYTWSAGSPFTAADGTLFTTFLAGLNAGSGFANHTDWRIPTIAELETIIDYTTSIPSVSVAFNSNCTLSCSVTTCSCTAPQDYWSSTTNVGGTSFAWFAFFSAGGVSFTNKGSAVSARGVRGGS
jgi:hypothetical protein